MVPTTIESHHTPNTNNNYNIVLYQPTTNSSNIILHLTMVDISVTLAGIPLTSCVYNASGPRTGSSAAMSKINKSASGGVLAKSATLVSQKGNDLPRCVLHGGVYICAIALCIIKREHLLNSL